MQSFKLNHFFFFREALTSRTNHKKFPSLQELAAACIWTRKQLLIDTTDNPFNAIRKTALIILVLSTIIANMVIFSLQSQDLSPQQIRGLHYWLHHLEGHGSNGSCIPNNDYAAEQGTTQNHNSGTISPRKIQCWPCNLFLADFEPPVPKSTGSVSPHQF